jgi:hypothetical protein
MTPGSQSEGRLYIISLAPSTHPGKVSACSSNGHTFTASEQLFTGARYWLDQGASSATITTIWSSGPASLRSTIGHAAKLTVREGQRDSPYFTDWTPFPSD